MNARGLVSNWQKISRNPPAKVCRRINMRQRSHRQKSKGGFGFMSRRVPVLLTRHTFTQRAVSPQEKSRQRAQRQPVMNYN